MMRGVFDDEGYYKTGDLVRRKKLDYFVLGRLSEDGTYAVTCSSR